MYHPSAMRKNDFNPLIPGAQSGTQSHLAIVRIYIVKPRFETILAIVPYAADNDDMLNK